MANLKEEGTIDTWTIVVGGKWPESEGVTFPQIRADDMTLEIASNKDKKLQVKICGIFDEDFTFVCPVPALIPVPISPGRLGFRVTVSWKRPQVTLSLNSEEIGSKRMRLH